MDRERDPELPAVGRDLGGIIALAHDAHDANTLAGQVGGEFCKHRRILLRERTGRMEEREADGPAVGPD